MRKALQTGKAFYERWYKAPATSNARRTLVTKSIKIGIKKQTELIIEWYKEHRRQGRNPGVNEFIKEWLE